MTTPNTRPRGRPRSRETQQLIEQVNAMLPVDAETEAMIRRCSKVGGQEAVRLMQEFVAARKPREQKRIAQAHALQNAQRDENAALARQFAERMVAAYNEHFTQPDGGVLTTLVSLYLVFADAAARQGDGLDMTEVIEGYWPPRVPRGWAAGRCYEMACRAGLAARAGLYLDMHDRYPSRSGYPEPRRETDGSVHAEQRRIAIGIDDDGRLIEIGLREKRELQAASYVVAGSLGAWLGFMARMPPDDWDMPRTLPNPNWSPEWGHPANILPERSTDMKGMFDNCIFPVLLGEERARGFAAVEDVWAQRRETGQHLDEPSFTPDEAIQVFGAVVGSCEPLRAAALDMYRFCFHRARSGALRPRWSLRLCRSRHCGAPLFIRDIPNEKGNASLPNYCKSCALSVEAERQLRLRRRAKRTGP